MSMDPSEFLPPGLGDELASMFRKTMGSVQDMLEERYVYEVCENIFEVNELAAEGWALAQVCYRGPGALTFVMHSKLGAADAADALLRNARNARRSEKSLAR